MQGPRVGSDHIIIKRHSFGESVLVLMCSSLALRAFQQSHPSLFFRLHIMCSLEVHSIMLVIEEKYEETDDTPVFDHFISVIEV